MELHKSLKEKEVFYYFNAKKEKLWLFRHRFYDPITGKRKEKKKSSFKTEKAAMQALLEVKAQTLRGEINYIENDNLTVGQWLDIWFETNQNKWKPSTVVQRESFIRLQLKPLLGSIKLKQLDKLIYQRCFLNALEKKYKPSTIRSFHVIIRTALNAAVQEDIIPKNKLAGIAVPIRSQHSEEKNYLTPDQLNVLLPTIKENEHKAYYSLFFILAYTGMRKGEALGLQWRNIDFDNHTITIERHRGNLGVGSTKTKNSERTIKVDKTVITQLETYCKAVKVQLLRYGKKLNDNLSEDDSFIFISPTNGLPMVSTGLNVIFNRNIKKAKLPATTIHGLRHTHATILMNNQIPVKAIAERLGNTPEMIHTVYGHVLKEMEDHTVAVFSDSLNKSGAKSGAN